MRRSLILFLLSGIIFTDMMGYGIVIPLMPHYQEKLGIGREEAGFLFASYALVQLLALLPFGEAVDRWGRKKFILVGMGLLAGCSLVFIRASTFGELLWARMIQGMAAACTWTAALPLASEIASEARRGMELSFITLSGGLGGILGPVIGGLGSPTTPFLILALLSASLLLSSLLLLREEREEKEVYAGRRFWELIRERGLLAACAAIGAQALSCGLFELLFSLHVADLGFERSACGYALGIFAGASVASQPLVGRWTDRAGRLPPLLLGHLIMASLLPLSVVYRDPREWYPLMIGLGVGGSCAFVPISPLIADHIPPLERGRAYALNNLAWCAGYFVGPWMGGALAESCGFLLPLLLSAGILVGTAIFIFFLMRGR